MFAHNQRTMVDGRPEEVWKFTVDTEATAAGERKTGIPFNLYNRSGAYLDVDWGDGTISRLTNADYTQSNSTASVHEYAEAGTYQIQIKSKTWQKLYILALNVSGDISTISNANASLYWWKRTLISVDNALPCLKGRNYYSTATNTTLTNVLDFNYIFCKCSFLTSIPSGLFDNNRRITGFCSCFSGCSSLQSIPSGLFDNNTENTNFWACFSGCSSLASIPSGLFDSNVNVGSFSECFRGCNSITSIPSGLFDSNTLATNFYCCFYNCTSLQSIPSGLFDNNTLATNFLYCFYNCTSLQSIPSGLFDSNTAVTSFGSCFSDCTSLQSIPEGLFDNNTAVTSFDSCFYRCTSFQSIPEGLFDNNTAVTDFNGCFSNCSSLASIPSGLFDNNTAVTDFESCFYYCSSLTDFTLHIGSSLVSSCSSFVTKKAGTTRTIYVPDSSTTYTTFSNQATTLGLTIVTE